MIKKIFFLFCALGIIPISYAFTLPEVLQKLEANEQTTQTVQFDFEQNILFVANAIESNVKGFAQFKKPQQMRITRKEPDRQVTISNGKKMWVFNPQFNQVWEGSWKGWLNAAVIPKGMLPVNDYVKELKENFSLSLMEKNKKSDDLVQLKAVPKDEFAGYHLELFISTSVWFPIKTRFISDTAQIETNLSNFEINPNFKNDIFTFTPTKGIEVISLN